MDRCDECKHKAICICLPYGCESFEIDLAEHDKRIKAELLKEYMMKDCTSCEAHLREQIRAEVIEEVKGLAQHYLIGFMDLENATKYGNKNAKQQEISYGSLMRYEIANCVDDFIEAVERLKEQK